jgi:vacuolar-type H+-ATPase subunit E/Vma4
VALEDILHSIRADTDAQIGELESAAAAEIASIAARADAESARVHGESAASLDARTDREVAGILDRARLDARRASLRAIETAYQGVVTELGELLGTVRGTAIYPDVFVRLLDEGLGVLDESSRLLVDAADEELARTVVRERGLDGLVVEVRRSTAGGLDLATEDGRVVHNTFESRLDRAEGRLRGLVARELSDREAP